MNNRFREWMVWSYGVGVMKKKRNIKKIVGRFCMMALMMFSLQSCFSAMSPMGGGNPSPGAKAAYAAADVVTAPVQVPLMVTAVLLGGML